MEWRRRDLKWTIIFPTFVALCLMSMSHAQDNSQDKAAIESALKGSFLNEGDLPAGIPWEIEQENRFNGNDERGYYADQFWTASYRSEMSKDNYIYKNYKINVAVEYHNLQNAPFETAEEHRNWSLRPFEGAIWKVSSYDGLPGGALYWWPDSMPMYQIAFWKNINYMASVTFSYSISGGKPTTMEDENYVLSECKRLAKLIYDRLPGGLPKFGIKGDVLEVGSFAGIPNSIVTITFNGNPIRIVAADPEDGSYFVPLEPDTYGVIASAPGYIPSEGMSEDHVVVTPGVNTTYNLRLLEMPPVANNTSEKKSAEYVPYQGKDAATIAIRNEQICNTGSYNSCANESNCGYSTGVATTYGLCIINATLSSQEARDSWAPPSELGGISCVDIAGITSIEALQPNEWSYSVPAGNYTIMEYLHASEVNQGFSKSPCTHWWLKPPEMICLQRGETRRFKNSGYEWTGDSKCTAEYFGCSKCLQFIPEHTYDCGIVA